MKSSIDKQELPALSNSINNLHNSETDSINSQRIKKLENEHKVVDVNEADLTVAFMNVHDKDVPEINKQQERKLRVKIFIRVFALTFLINLLMYMDKATLSYLAILGFWENTGLDQNKYNNVNTIFYVGFFVGQIPGPYITQKLPLRYLMVGITFLWSIIIFLHCAAYNYAGVIVLRFFLGLTESLAIPIMTTTNAMFLTKNERDSTQPIFYASCLASPIPIGFIAYGIIYANSKIGDYRVLNIIIGGLTFILSILLYFIYPNNPIDANFLSTEEKVWVIRRVTQTTNSSIEQRHFKRHQATEAFKDPITWLFCSAFFLQQLANNLPYQQNLLFEEMGGLSNLNSTLVSVAGSGYAVLWSILACIVMFIYPNTSFLTSIWVIIPCLIGSILAVSLNIKNSIGMLAAICMASQSFGVQWIIMFGLAKATARSQTKTSVRSALMMASYSVSNIISPQLWQGKDAPRYYPAWIVQIVLSFFTAPVLLAITWYILARRNRFRKDKIDSAEKIGFMKDDEGHEIIVNSAALDLTDLEDETFLYPL